MSPSRTGWAPLRAFTSAAACRFESPSTESHHRGHGWLCLRTRGHGKEISDPRIWDVIADELSVVALTLCRNAQKWKSTREKGRRQQNAETNSCRQAERPDDELSKHRRCRGGIGNRSFRHHHHKSSAQNTPIERRTAMTLRV